MKKILIIVDVQSKFKSNLNEHVYDKLKDIDYSIYLHVYATKFVTNKSNPNFEKLLNFTIKKDNLELSNIDYIEVEKCSYGLPLDFLQQIKKEGIEQVDIIGTDYDSCVLAIGFQIFDIGIVPKFYKNLIASHSTNSIDFETAQQIYKRNFGKDCFI